MSQNLAQSRQTPAQVPQKQPASHCQTGHPQASSHPLLHRHLTDPIPDSARYRCPYITQNSFVRRRSLPQAVNSLVPPPQRPS